MIMPWKNSPDCQKFLREQPHTAENNQHSYKCLQMYRLPSGTKNALHHPHLPQKLTPQWD